MKFVNHMKNITQFQSETQRQLICCVRKTVLNCINCELNTLSLLYKKKKKVFCCAKNKTPKCFLKGINV